MFWNCFLFLISMCRILMSRKVYALSKNKNDLGTIACATNYTIYRLISGFPSNILLKLSDKLVKLELKLRKQTEQAFKIWVKRWKL